MRINARLEMVTDTGKIAFGRTMSGTNVDIGDLVKRFFEIMPESIKKYNLKIQRVERY